MTIALGLLLAVTGSLGVLTGIGLVGTRRFLAGAIVLPLMTGLLLSGWCLMLTGHWWLP